MKEVLFFSSFLLSYYFRFAYLFSVSKHNVKVVLKKYHIHIMLEEFEDTKGVSKSESIYRRRTKEKYFQATN
jgi:hypothetical protein